MEIVLIRHAQPERWEGWGPADPSLTSTGIAQTQNLIEHLASSAAPEFTSVYASTMARAVQTAAPLARALDLPLTTDPDLVEYDHGLNFYIPTEDIESDFENYWNNLQRGWYGGHQLDLPAFQKRVTGAINRIVDAHGEDDRVAIVCHGGVISAFLAATLDNSKPLFFEPDYTSLTRVHIYPGGRRHVVSANETPHMGFWAWEPTFA